MKNAQTATPNRDALIDFIKQLTPEQADLLVYNLPLLQRMAKMSFNELIFTNVILEKIYGAEHA